MTYYTLYNCVESLISSNLVNPWHRRARDTGIVFSICRSVRYLEVGTNPRNIIKFDFGIIF